MPFNDLVLHDLVLPHPQATRYAVSSGTSTHRGGWRGPHAEDSDQ